MATFVLSLACFIAALVLIKEAFGFEGTVIVSLAVIAAYLVEKEQGA